MLFKFHSYLFVDAALEEWSEGSVNQDRVVKLGRGGSDVNGLHLLEAAERVALAHQLCYRPLVQRPRDQQHDVVDHVAVGDVIQEHGQLACGVVPHVLELGHQLLPQLIIDHGHLKTVGQQRASNLHRSY